MHKLTATKAGLDAVLAKMPSGRSGLLLKAAGSDLLVRSAGDHEMVSAKVRTGVEVSDGFVAHLPAQAARIIKALPGAEVTITVEDTSATVSSGGAVVNLMLLDAAAFPNSKPIPVELIEFPAAVLTESLNRVRFAASSDAARVALTGVQFSIAGGKLSLVATDSYRLARTTVDVDTATETSVLVPVSAVSSLLSLLSGDTVRLGVTPGSHVYFTDGSVSVIANAIAADYPQVDRIIPESFPTVVTVDRVSLSDALAFVAVTGDKDSGVVFTADKEGVVATPRLKSEYASQASFPLDGKVTEGAPIQFALDRAYLDQAVRAVGTDTVELKLIDQMKPVRVTGPGDTTTQIIMPVRPG